MVNYAILPGSKRTIVGTELRSITVSYLEVSGPTIRHSSDESVTLKFTVEV